MDRLGWRPSCDAVILPFAVEDGLQQLQQRYDEFDQRVRKLLWLRALCKLGVQYADAALAIRDTFVQVCLIGCTADHQPGPPTVQQAAQVSMHGN